MEIGCREIAKPFKLVSPVTNKIEGQSRLECGSYITLRLIRTSVRYR